MIKTIGMDAVLPEKNWVFPEEIKIVDKNDISGCTGRLQPGVEAEYADEKIHFTVVWR